MKRKVLVTGSTGALGLALTSQLVTDTNNFIVFAPNRMDNQDRLDLGNRDQIFLTIDRIRPDLIINLAATYSNEFEEAYTVNVSASRHILEAIKTYGLNTRVVLIGSAAEYGAVKAEENPIIESHVLRPTSIYGITKAWQTELAYYYSSLGMDVVVARIFNLVGPNLSDRLFAGKMHKQIKEVLSGSRLNLEFGALSAIRDYLTIDKAVKQLLSITNFGESGLVYHVASGQPTSMRALLLRELEANGLDESIIIEDSKLTNRLGFDVPSIYADITKTNDLIMNPNKNV